MRYTALALALLSAFSLNAQVSKDKPKVEKLCGCFEVEFKYAETFSPDKNYKYHDREEISGGTELTFPVEVSDKRMVMQHLLVITDSMIVKHWREEWTYENPVIWKYNGDKVWVKEQLKPEQVKGKWTQSVWEVSDEPRYQGVSDWVMLDGKATWKNTTDAPLPRREYSTRSDYNILKRTNSISINDSGYIHEQDNQKIVRANGTDKLLVEEKGINSYKRLPDEECAAAKYYWDNNKIYWGKVRKAWENYINTHNTVALKTKVDGKVLHDYLFALEKDYRLKKVSDTEIDGRIQAEIDRFTGSDKPAVASK
ncbi:MAG: hypothetical protein EOO05_21485 [Chitinophagaceae bacterium]|nr:MAG: hypothetical protein EOO05_21485 [Chitinophagaceae bacterium]